MTWEDVKVQVTAEVKKLLEERHILADEVKQVIHHAEAQSEKLYQPGVNVYLAKLRIGKATFYVEYSIEDGNYIVRSAYAHKAEIPG